MQNFIVLARDKEELLVDFSAYIAEYIAEERARGEDFVGYFMVRNAIEAFLGGAR